MIVRYLGLVDYGATMKAMQDFTAIREQHTHDELWLLEHPSVFTLGQAGKREHLLYETLIPVEQSDRGGQITYHGPGQLIGYLLMDIKRAKYGVRQLVRQLEQAVINLLKNEYHIDAYGRPDAPGVYVNAAKIAALGLRIRNGCSYHGISFNVNMDLEPFKWMNPCGYQGLQTTQLKDLGVVTTAAELQQTFAGYLQQAIMDNFLPVVMPTLSQNLDLETSSG